MPAEVLDQLLDGGPTSGWPAVNRLDAFVLADGRYVPSLTWNGRNPTS